MAAGSVSRPGAGERLHSGRDVAEALHDAAVLAEYPLHLGAGQDIPPLFGLADPEETLRLLRPLATTLGVLLPAQRLEGGHLDRPLQLRWLGEQQKEAGEAAKG